MIEQEIERKIEDFRELGIPEYIKREGLVPVAGNMVSTIIGARRAGKSFRAIQVADELMDQNVIKSIHQVCLIDFDNPVLSIMKAQDLKLIQDTFLKLNH